MPDVNSADSVPRLRHNTILPEYPCSGEVIELEKFSTEEIREGETTSRTRLHENQHLRISMSLRKVVEVTGCLLLTVSLVGCRDVPSVGAQSRTSQNRTVSQGQFTPGSAVVNLDENTWYIGVEALLPPPNAGSEVIVADRGFKLPPNGTITKLEGTFGFIAPFGNTSYTSCTQPNAALGFISVDGKRIPFAIHVDSGGHRDRDLFFSYDIPVKYTQGNADVHIEANPLGCWSDVEIQALMRVEFQ